MTWDICVADPETAYPLKERCSLPLTAHKAVARIYTDLAIIEVTPDGFVLRELAPGIDLGSVRARTAAPLLCQGV